MPKPARRQIPSLAYTSADPAGPVPRLFGDGSITDTVAFFNRPRGGSAAPKGYTKFLLNFGMESRAASH